MGVPQFALVGIVALAALLAGWALASLRAARQRASLEAELSRRQQALAERDRQLEELQQEKKHLGSELEQLRQQLAEAKVEQAKLETRLEESERSIKEKLALLQQAEQQLQQAFAKVSGEALQKNSELFLHLARQALEKQQQAAVHDLEKRQQAINDMVKPLQETLQRLEQNLQQVGKDHAGVRETLRLLDEAQKLLRAETQNLVQALRTPVTRGRWGEIQLRRVVELAGMAEHCDFDEQPTVDGADGRQRPDMVIHLPNGRQIVVDAKVSLKAYLESLEATDEEARRRCLAEHAQQIRAHLTRLGSKNYWDQFDRAPEFVVAFLPGEVFFSAALQQDPELIEFGVSKRVILATPTTLIALLKAVSYGWQHYELTRNAQQIRQLGRELHDRLRAWAEHLADIGKSLERVVERYNRAVGSLESRVLPMARRFRELGVDSPAEIPELNPVDKDVRGVQVPESELTALPDSARYLSTPGPGGGSSEPGD